MLVQELARMILKTPIYEHQALAILERAKDNAALLRKLERIEPQWVHDYCASQEWYVHKGRQHWQITAPKDRWKPYAYFCLKMKKSDNTADIMWSAIQGIAQHYKTTMDNVIKEVMSYANVIDQLASIGEE